MVQCIRMTDIGEGLFPLKGWEDDLVLRLKLSMKHQYREISQPAIQQISIISWQSQLDRYMDSKKSLLDEESTCECALYIPARHLKRPSSCCREGCPETHS